MAVDSYEHGTDFPESRALDEAPHERIPPDEIAPLIPLPENFAVLAQQYNALKLEVVTCSKVLERIVSDESDSKGKTAITILKRMIECCDKQTDLLRCYKNAVFRLQVRFLEMRDVLDNKPEPPTCLRSEKQRAVWSFVQQRGSCTKEQIRLELFDEHQTGSAVQAVIDRANEALAEHGLLDELIVFRRPDGWVIGRRCGDIGPH